MDEWGKIGVGGLIALLFVREVIPFFMRALNIVGKTKQPESKECSKAVEEALSRMADTICDHCRVTNELKRLHEHEAPDQPGVRNWWITKDDRKAWIATVNKVSALQRDYDDMKRALRLWQETINRHIERQR